MTGLARPARRYWAGTLCAALALYAFALTLTRPDAGTEQRPALALAFAGLLILAKLFPLHVALKTKLTLDTIVLFAAILLFDPVTAMTVAGVGTLLTHAIRRKEWVQALFNGAHAMLRVGVGTLLLAVVAWDPAHLTFNQPAQLAMLVVAAGAMYYLDVLVIATMVALQVGLPLAKVWRQSLGLAGAEEFSQLGLGLLAATIVDVHPWALPLFLLPALAIYRSLERHVQLRQQTLDAVEALADMVDLRDRYTSAHSYRVASFARELAIALGLSPQEVDLIERAARVHDVGKVTVDSAILTKEGPLTDEEWAHLKRHPVTGAEILGRFPQFALATRYVRHHHERIDGTGYPDGLSGDAIPLGARIIAVADALDSMISARPYRPAFAPEVVLAEFSRQRGRQWDHQVVDRLLELVNEERIALSPAPLPGAPPMTPSGQARKAPA